MAECCDHEFQDAPALFASTARTRACQKCDRVEVMLASTGEWVAIDAYMQRRIANNSAAD